MKLAGHQINRELFEAIERFKKMDTFQLSLEARKYPHLDLPFIIQQLDARKKAKNKLPEWYSNDKILFPASISMEQSSSEITAKYKSDLFQGESLVDLTGGAGIDTYYLSKGFNEVTYLERQEELESLAKYNFQLLGAFNIKTHNGDSIEYLNSLNEKPTHIYVDPARRDGNNQKVHSFLDCEPNILGIVPEVLDWGSKLLIKASPMLDISLGLSQLQNVAEVHIVSVKNDCKELLFFIDPEFSGETTITTTNFSGESIQRFSFSLEEQKQAQEQIGNINKYLYEPNASLLKAGAFKLLSEHFGITKLNSNTHIYSSEDLISDFPGRKFLVHWSGKPSKKEFTERIPNGKANVAIRNFPQSVDQIKKKFKIKDGGDKYLFFYRNESNKPEVAICEKA